MKQTDLIFYVGKQLISKTAAFYEEYDWDENPRDYDEEWFRDDEFPRVKGRGYNPNYFGSKRLNVDKIGFLEEEINSCFEIITTYLNKIDKIIEKINDNISFKLMIFNKKYKTKFTNTWQKNDNSDSELTRNLKNEDNIDMIQDFYDNLKVINEIINHEYDKFNQEIKSHLLKIIKLNEEALLELKWYLVEIKKHDIIETKEDTKRREEEWAKKTEEEREEERYQAILEKYLGPSEDREIDWRPTETIPEDYYAL